MENTYQDKLDKHIHDITNLMITFEVTKQCGYSAFITVYKNKSLLDLYQQVMDHFQISEIKELFFYKPSGERIHIPISKKTIHEFVQSNITGNNINLIAIYPLPRPTIYRLFVR